MRTRRLRENFLVVADALNRLERLLVIALMSAMCLAIIAGVFWRYILDDALSWTEETGRYLMIWMGFIGVAPALREGNHIAVDLLIGSLPPRSRRVLILIIRILCMTFLLSIAGAGLVLVSKVGGQVTPVLGISTAIPYLAIPAGAFLTIVEMIALMIRDPDQHNHIRADDDPGLETT